jgi:hypothetical protein
MNTPAGQGLARGLDLGLFLFLGEHVLFDFRRYFGRVLFSLARLQVQSNCSLSHWSRYCTGRRMPQLW